VPLAAATAAVAVWFAVPGNLGKPATTDELARARAPHDSGSRETAPAAAVPELPENKTASVEAQPKPAASPLAQAPPAPLPPAERRDNLVQREARQADAAHEAARPTPAEAAGANVQADKDVAPAAPAAAAAQKAERVGIAGAVAITPSDIVSPDPAIRWRLAGSAVQHSSDGGSTWEAVSIGFPAELTAGVAPASNVCWLVGRNGVVLLTIDGRTWRRVSFPEAADLVGIRTVDAGGRVATVTTADGRTFVTTDAGGTWASRP
jgi:hypothetical protein